MAACNSNSKKNTIDLAVILLITAALLGEEKADGEAIFFIISDIYSLMAAESMATGNSSDYIGLSMFNHGFVKHSIVVGRDTGYGKMQKCNRFLLY